jgi:hypothetical protein
MEASDRRGFLAAMARRAAQGAREIAKDAGNPGKMIARYVDLAPEPEDVAPALRPEARAPTRCASIEELRGLVEDCLLSHRTDALEALALPSVRLTPSSPADGAGWLASAAALSRASAGNGEGEILVGQVDLSSVAAAGTEPAQPAWLGLYLGPAPGGPKDAWPARAVLTDSPEDAALDARPVAAWPELTLPRVWAAPVEDLSLDETERDAYTELRWRLAEAQGLDGDDGGGVHLSYHRLLGYPNETTGLMPAACAVAIASDPEHAHRHWRLLAQISLAESYRLYFWTRSSALERGELEPVVAFRR